MVNWLSPRRLKAARGAVGVDCEPDGRVDDRVALWTVMGAAAQLEHASSPASVRQISRTEYRRRLLACPWIKHLFPFCDTAKASLAL